MSLLSFHVFFNDTATTEIYTLSLHDALPIFHGVPCPKYADRPTPPLLRARSEEHTSELQSLRHLVCRLLLEKKKKTTHQQVDARDSTRQHSTLCPSERR